MEKTRVNKREKYWYITELGYVASDTEININVNNIDGLRAEKGNYFYTEEEAEQMARKLRAILNGADVVNEMPSESDVAMECIRLYGKHEDGMKETHAFWDGVNYVKSKIVK